MQVDHTRIELTTYRGGLALVGSALLDVVEHYDTIELPKERLHITLLTSSEYKSITKPELRNLDVPLHRIYPLGQAISKNVRFLPVVWNHADKWRKSLGLPRKEYLITLSDENDHDIGKGVPTLLARADGESILEKVISMGEDAMDHLVEGCWGDLSLVSMVSPFQLGSCRQLIRSYRDGVCPTASSSRFPTRSRPICGSPKSGSMPSYRCWRWPGRPRSTHP